MLRLRDGVAEHSLPELAMDITGSNPGSRRRYRPRLSVRALMAVVLVLAVWLGWYLHTVRTQQAAVRAIKEAGGWVAYDWDWANYDPNITSYQGKPRAPKWLSNLVGVDYVANVGQVSLVSGNSKKADDRTLESVSRLSRLKSLWLDGSAVTDAGMVHLKGNSCLSGRIWCQFISPRVNGVIRSYAVVDACQ